MSLDSYICLFGAKYRHSQMTNLSGRLTKIKAPTDSLYCVVSISLLSCIQTIKSHANLFSKWFHIFLSLSKLPKMEIKPISYEINKLKQCATLIFCVAIAAMVEFIGRSFRVLAYFNWIWYCVYFFFFRSKDIIYLTGECLPCQTFNYYFGLELEILIKGIFCHNSYFCCRRFLSRIIWLFLVCVRNVVGSIIQWLSSMVFFFILLIVC